jgi:hypothetical protein
MNTRAKLRAVAAMVVSLVSVVGLQGATPAMAAPRVVHATGMETITGIDFVDIVSRGQQCLLRVNQTVMYEGTLEGTAETVRPSELRYFATCDELMATGGVGIARTFSGVVHFVGADGTEATIRAVGRADAEGNYRGIAAVHGDLNGILVETQTAASGPTATYDGTLVVKD